MSDTVSTVSPSISHEVMGPDAMTFVFLMLSFRPSFSLSCFTFIKRLCSSPSLSAIRVGSSAYLRLLVISPSNIDSNLQAGQLSKKIKLKVSKGERKKQNYLYLQMTGFYIQTVLRVLLMHLINRFSKAVGYKINIQNKKINRIHL